ncbi:hypothetical protein O9Y75_29315, partial [Klebsiella pneumoniae]|nr:hypothetical protein [Klebsiella pneumoniae]
IICISRLSCRVRALIHRSNCADSSSVASASANASSVHAGRSFLLSFFTFVLAVELSCCSENYMEMPPGQIL